MNGETFEVKIDLKESNSWLCTEAVIIATDTQYFVKDFLIGWVFSYKQLFLPIIAHLIKTSICQFDLFENSGFLVPELVVGSGEQEKNQISMYD